MFRPNKVSKFIQIALIVFMLTASLLAGSGSSAQAMNHADAPQLFGDVPTTDAATTAEQPAFVARSRFVTINSDVLLHSAGAGAEIALNIFPDLSLTGVVSEVQSNANTTSWIGKIKEDELGYFYAVTVGDAMIVHIATAQGIYEVSTAPGTDGLYKVVQIDQSKLKEDAPGKVADSGPVLTAGTLGSTADSGATIDVMVVYTTAARIAEGSTNAMQARIALAMTESNQAYANSGITPRLRLVHTEEVSYTETGSMSIDLNRLVGTSDGFMDNVHALRSTYGADMVSLVVDSADACGLADAIMATATTAFQVVARSGCMTGNYSFSHEFGHLQGARHDRYVDPTNTPYQYGHGYTYPSAGWRTIMAYNDYCTYVGKYCTRLQYFSNPSKTYGGAAMGTTTYNKNYLVLNNTAYTVANFRASKIGSDFSSSFNGASSGWTPVSGTWAYYNSAYYYTTGIANAWSSIYHTGTYGDLTYTVKMKRTGSTDYWANNIVIRGKPTTLTSNKDWMSTYQFAYTNDGYFAVWKVSSTGSETGLINWTYTPVILQRDWNTLKVVAVGHNFLFYINGSLVWAGSDTSFRVGQVGVQMFRDSSSTGNKLYVDSAVLTNSPTAPATLAPTADASPATNAGGDNTASPH